MRSFLVLCLLANLLTLIFLGAALLEKTPSINKSSSIVVAPSKNRFKNKVDPSVSIDVEKIIYSKVESPPFYDVNQKEYSLKFKNWGLINYDSENHINILDAWKIEKGKKDIVIAVIDTGIDSNHPSLKTNLWKGFHVDKSTNTSKEIFGWDFTKDEPNPTDEHGHGTHIAGIIGSEFNLKTGVSGVIQNSSLMILKYFSPANPHKDHLKLTISAINYAIDNGAVIINYSGGGRNYSKEEYLAIKRAEAKGVLFVAAAGNDRNDLDSPLNSYYPAGYELDNIISVAASDLNNNLISESNWGKTSVDVAAPGDDIYSTLPGGDFGLMKGTSQATAFVSGVAALLLSHDPSLTPLEIKRIIIDSVDRIPDLKDKVLSGGRINASAALNSLKFRKSQNFLAKTRCDKIQSIRVISCID